MYNFLVPDVAAAFDAYLATPIPNVNRDFKLTRDFSAAGFNWESCRSIRGFTTLINWKSSINNADMTYNFRTSLLEDIIRGDLIRDDITGDIGMVTWNVDRVIDCKKTQVTSCNVRINITREMPEVIDNETGILITPQETKTLISNFPAIFIEMYGRADYEQASNTPGIFADQDTDIRVQANPITLSLRSGDRIIAHGISHKIKVINRAQLSPDGQHGLLILMCDREEEMHGA